jgi:hypothetical protein
MKGKTKKIVLAVAVIGAIAAGGVAFTAANTVPNSVAGYGTSTVSGTTASSIHHILSADGTTITHTTMVLLGDMTGKTIHAGFDVADLSDSTCTATNYVADGAAPTDPTLGTTDVDCVYGTAVNTHDNADTFSVSVAS